MNALHWWHCWWQPSCTQEKGKTDQKRKQNKSKSPETECKCCWFGNVAYQPHQHSKKIMLYLDKTFGHNLTIVIHFAPTTTQNCNTRPTWLHLAMFFFLKNDTLWGLVLRNPFYLLMQFYILSPPPTSISFWSPLHHLSHHCWMSHHICGWVVQVCCHLDHLFVLSCCHHLC
jgi:hypothetical protein